MAAAALRELESLPAEHQGDEEVLQMRLFVYMKSRRWEEALAVCMDLRDFSPESTSGYIHSAFCLHEMGRTQEAKQMLLDGPACLLKDATYHYNLGCYDAILGNHEAAIAHLQTSFQMDKKFREIAKYDPDLKSVQNLLE